MSQKFSQNWLLFFPLFFFIQEALIAMAPKQKASNSPTGVKPDKNCNKIKKENFTALKDDDDDNKKGNLGKNEIEKRNEVIGFYKFKGRASSLTFLDKKHNIKELELKSMPFNQLLNQKPKINLQGSLRWKTYLFPPTSDLTYPNEHHYYNYFGIDLVDEDKERTHWTHKPSV